MNFDDFAKWSALSAAVMMATGCGPSEETPEDTAVEAAPPPYAAAATTDAPESNEGSKTVAIETVDARVSYGLGYNLGASMASQGGVEAELDAIVAGIKDGLAFKEPRVSEQLLVEAFESLEQRANEAASSPDAAANLAEALSWLEKNAQKSEVTVQNSGLQYEVLESGPDDAPSPGPDSTVRVHYHGTLVDGTVFDSSIDRGEPVSFPVARVIDGWTEALQLMSVGDRWRLFIPPHLGYGARGAGGIPANAVLIFEVELLGIK